MGYVTEERWERIKNRDLNDEMQESGCKTRADLFVSAASGMESAAWRAYGSVYRNGLLFEETRRSEAAREAKPSPPRQTSSECGSEPTTQTNSCIQPTLIITD